jgi:hypothetical protein
MGPDRVGARFPKWAWILSIPFACSCAPWVYWFCVVDKSTGSDLEGALFTAAILGIASFLVTGPLTAAQLRLAPRPQLSFKAYAILYYTISGPTLIFQTVAFSSSFLAGLIPGSYLVSNATRTVVLTGMLGVVLYAVCAALMKFVITKIGEAVP